MTLPLSSRTKSIDKKSHSRCRYVISYVSTSLTCSSSSLSSSNYRFLVQSNEKCISIEVSKNSTKYIVFFTYKIYAYSPLKTLPTWTKVMITFISWILSPSPIFLAISWMKSYVTESSSASSLGVFSVTVWNIVYLNYNNILIKWK